MKEDTTHMVEMVRFQVKLFTEMLTGSLPVDLKEELELHIQAGREILYLSDKLAPQHVDAVIDQMVSRMTDRMESHLKPLFEGLTPYRQDWAAT